MIQIGGFWLLQPANLLYLAAEEPKPSSQSSPAKKRWLR